MNVTPYHCVCVCVCACVCVCVCVCVYVCARMNNTYMYARLTFNSGLSLCKLCVIRISKSNFRSSYHGVNN